MRRRVLLAVAVGVALVVLFAYNAIPGLTVPPNEDESRVCEGDVGYSYRWAVPDHAWECSAHWYWPGFHGLE
jgi:hypothetical protein